MKKKIIIGCIFAAFIMIALPSTSVAESQSAKERLELEQVIYEQLEENLIIKDDPFGPTIILRALLLMRNLLLLTLFGGIVIVWRLSKFLNRLRNLFNLSASTV
jgi:hypothetical protein